MVTMENQEYAQLMHEIDLMEQALQKIVACDYRGNMPTEQSIAKSTLERLAEMRKKPGGDIQTA
jgi:hypothetical protein